MATTLPSGTSATPLWWRYASPPAAYRFAGRWWAFFALSAVLLAGAGLYMGFVVAPTDAQQGEAYRIIYVHVPAAWMSMLIYLAMAAWSGLGLVLNARLSATMAHALAPTGAVMTLLALVTGSLWGKPTWGTWWVWDARLTSELVLLFLYLGVMSLHAAIDDPRRADRASALLTLVGVVNIPIIYFSVRWWNTLHQGASVSLDKPPSIATPMLLGMLLMVAAFWCYAIAVALLRLRVLLLEREGHAAWARPDRRGT
ncbi:MAG: heme ABC transporter permease [Hydrogenophaga sp.]|jgi:heme exporter protein C|uniref:Heme exporter protein C n=1 Tax=Hydrogenophaga crocea TaxID=2716225 RepID=A0A6G8IBY3_9BURK|nr:MULTISPECIES: heme ABC transporter permease [Hydrogenophaga]MBL0943661.1 heme ABC transporter permease [Hydrogenophaga sp.]QIM50639.1 heme ABC transporter permease [Hydrogenophaga crocea]